MKALYAGSFDPPTIGHMHVIWTAAKLFDELYIIVAVNPAKKTRFSIVERVQMLTSACEPKLASRIYVHYVSGEFVARLAEQLGCEFMIRGVRSATDFDAERLIDHVNAIAAPKVQTILVPSPEPMEKVSSSLVMSLVGLLGWRGMVRPMVPAATMHALEMQRWNQLNNVHPIAAIELVKHYNESQRHYHNLGHIVDCLEWATFYTNNHGLVGEDFVLLTNALAFHDAIYNPQEPSNEFESAQLASQHVHENHIKKVGDLIDATARHFLPDYNPTDELTQVMLDIDLASLGEPPAEYDHLTLAIRREYAFVPPEIYCDKRAELLQKLLDRPNIYRTEFFRKRLEESARANINREIFHLRRGEI